MKKEKYNLVSKNINGTKIKTVLALSLFCISLSCIGCSISRFIMINIIQDIFNVGALTIFLFVTGLLFFGAALTVMIVLGAKTTLVFKEFEVTIIEKNVKTNKLLGGLTKYQIARDEITHIRRIINIEFNTRRTNYGEIELYFGTELYTVYVHNINEVKKYILKYTGKEPTDSI